MEAISLTDPSSLRHLCVDLKPILPTLNEICFALQEVEGYESKDLKSTVSSMLALQSVTPSSLRKCPPQLIRPFLDLVRAQMSVLCPERTEAVCELFHWRLVAGKYFNIRKALEKANRALTNTQELRIEEPALGHPQKQVEVIQLFGDGPRWNSSPTYEDVVQSAARSDDVIFRSIECTMRVGLCGGASGFELKALALPGDAFELALYIQNYHASVNDDLVVTIQLPDRVTYIPGHTFVVKRQDDRDWHEPIPEENVYRLDQILKLAFSPRSHDAADSVYVHLLCRIANYDQFPFGATDLACRAIATIGTTQEVSNLVTITTRRPRQHEQSGVLSLLIWNKWATEERWIHRGELIAAAGDDQRFRVIVTNHGTSRIKHSYVEFTWSHQLTFQETAERHYTDVKMETVRCQYLGDNLRLPILNVDPGTANSQLFILDAVLEKADAIVTIKARWITDDLVLASDYVELRSSPTT